MSDYRTEEVVVTAITVALITLFISFGILAHDCGFEEGYTTALQDMKKNNPPKYILVEQKDGTTVWKENEATK